jgi:hypothetical protein
MRLTRDCDRLGRPADGNANVFKDRDAMNRRLRDLVSAQIDEDAVLGELEPVKGTLRRRSVRN